MARTIESPGVEIREIDLSLTENLPVGTNILAMGFAAQGPTDEIINVTSLSEYETIFGLPTNAAERYLYHTAKQISSSPGNLLITRLPYGSGAGEGYASEYSALVYPAVPVQDNTGGSTFTSASAFYFGQPTHVRLTFDDYTSITQNNVAWSNSITLSGTPLFSSLSAGVSLNAGMIIINDAKTVIDDSFSGYYVGIADNTTINPATTYNCVTGLMTVDENDVFTLVPPTKLTFNLTQPISGVRGSTSEIIESIPQYDFNTPQYNDSIIISVFKIRPSIYAQDSYTLDQILVEGYVGSFDEFRKVSTNDGTLASSFFLQDVINRKSANIKVYVNPNLSRSGWAGTSAPAKIARVITNSIPDQNAIHAPDRAAIASAGATVASNMYAVGNFSPRAIITVKDVGNIVAKIERNLLLAENPDVVPLDIMVEAGLGTIWATARQTGTLSAPAGFHSYIFDDTSFVNIGDLINTDGSIPTTQVYEDYATIFNTFDDFAQNNRKDHIFIADPLRQIFVNGGDSKVAKGRGFVFSRDIYWALRNLYLGANSSYSAAYGNWGKVYDPNTDKYCWLPMSGFAAQMFAKVDANYFPWTPAAGLNRGIINGIVDLAITPTQKQRDLLYRTGINIVAYFPSDGFVFIGQKTLLRRPSSFDRLNVRRLFLVLEKATQRTLRYFVEEPNTVFTRTRVRNTLTPIFSLAKNNEGVYDYLIVCDERNNTPDVIDANEMQVDIYLKAVRAAEFILVNFISTKTSQNFNELV